MRSAPMFLGGLMFIGAKHRRLFAPSMLCVEVFSWIPNYQLHSYIDIHESHGDIICNTHIEGIRNSTALCVEEDPLRAAMVFIQHPDVKLQNLAIEIFKKAVRKVDERRLYFEQICEVTIGADGEMKSWDILICMTDRKLICAETI